MSSTGDASLKLVLTPGAHWPAARSQEIPDDLPPGNLQIDLPLFPGAVHTDEQSERAAFRVPSTLYMKSACATYRTESDQQTVLNWYGDALTARGYTRSSSQTSRKAETVVSQGISLVRDEGTTRVEVSISAAAAKDGGTLLLHVATAVVPPVYPVPGSALRVPGSPVSLEITQYAGLNPGRHALQPLRSITVHDEATVQSIVDEINHLPKLTGYFMSCPDDDGSHLTLVFHEAAGARHVVRVGLRGCQFIAAPPAPTGRVGDNPDLLQRLTALLNGPGSREIPYPIQAETLTVVHARQLGSAPGRFLSAGQSGSTLLYLSVDALFMEPAAGGTPSLVATRVADAGLGINDATILLSLQGAESGHFVTIGRKTGTRQALTLPAGATLLGRTSGAGPIGLPDALVCHTGSVSFVADHRVHSINPARPETDTFHSAPLLPPSVPGERVALSWFGSRLALYQPGQALRIHEIRGGQAGGETVRCRVEAEDVSFLAWAPDDVHLAFRTGSTLSVLDIQTHHVTDIANLGHQVVHGAAWDPWCRVIALSVTAPDEPATESQVIVVDAHGEGSRSLPLPFRGATRLDWSTWRGETIGVTRMTPRGSEAWALTLPPFPVDPAASLG